LLVSPGVRADAATDAVAKLVGILEHVAVIVDLTKNDCDAMGNRLDAYYQQNAQSIQDAKAAADRLSDDQKQAIQARYRARVLAALAKIQPGVARCSSNPKVASLIQQFR
jgi:hypothetical protein